MHSVTTVPNAASLYTYIGLANYVPVTPFRLLDTRSGGPLGQGAIRALHVTGSVPRRCRSRRQRWC